MSLLITRTRALRLTPVAFRMYALGSRFLFVFFLAFLLTPQAVGLFGLVAATVGYVVYALGVDLYTYSTREIIKSDPSLWRTQLRSHGTLLVLVAVGVLPLASIIFFTGLLPWSVCLWFYLILVTEHLGYEIDRLLVATSRQFAASVVILIRQALLPTVAIPVMFLAPDTRTLEFVFLLWLVFNLLAVVVGSILLARYTVTGSPFKIDWRWMRRGLLVSVPFLIGTLCLRLIFTADRQVIAFFGGLEVLAAYTLAMTIANGLSSILTVGVYQFSYPSLVSAVAARAEVAFRAHLRSIWLQTGAIVVAVVALVAVLFYPLVNVLGKPVYLDYAWLIPTATIILAIYNLSMVPHYVLYAFHADRLILVSTVIAVILFAGIVVGGLLTGLPAVTATLCGVAAASIELFAVKYILARRVSRAYDWTRVA